MTTTDGLKASAALAATVALGMVALGLLSPGPEAGAGHVRAGDAPAGSYAVWSTALASPEAQRAVGIADAGRQAYVRARVCAVPGDGGDPGPLSVPGLFIVYDDETSSPCADGDPALEAWTEDRSDAPWACACSSGPTCLWTPPLYPSGRGDAGPAPMGQALSPGTWSGSGCKPVPCVVLAGVEPRWPAACLAPDGGAL